MSRKGHDRVPQPFVFLRTPVLYFWGGLIFWGGLWELSTQTHVDIEGKALIGQLEVLFPFSPSLPINKVEDSVGKILCIKKLKQLNGLYAAFPLFWKKPSGYASMSYEMLTM